MCFLRAYTVYHTQVIILVDNLGKCCSLTDLLLLNQLCYRCVTFLFYSFVWLLFVCLGQDTHTFSSLLNKFDQTDHFHTHFVKPHAISVTVSKSVIEFLPAASRIHHPQSSPHKRYVSVSAESESLEKDCKTYVLHQILSIFINKTRQNKWVSWSLDTFEQSRTERYRSQHGGLFSICLVNVTRPVGPLEREKQKSKNKEKYSTDTLRDTGIFNAYWYVWLS